MERAAQRIVRVNPRAIMRTGDGVQTPAEAAAPGRVGGKADLALDEVIRPGGSGGVARGAGGNVSKTVGVGHTSALQNSIRDRPDALLGQPGRQSARMERGGKIVGKERPLRRGTAGEEAVGKT